MTEAEWLSSNDLHAMLFSLRGKINSRKLRLFGVACCRRISHLLPDPRSRVMVEAAERVADDNNERKSFQACFPGAMEVIEQVCGPYNGPRSQLYRLLTDDKSACVAVFMLTWRAEASGLVDTAVLARYTASCLSEKKEQLNQCNLLRCIVGNPYHSSAIDQSWLRWNDGTIRKLAQSIYDERAFDRLPILADALEDAGCDNADILTHCRGPNEHVRGCWVVDLLLGKS